jgi:hypothetical protein
MCFLVVGENSGVVRFGQYDLARPRPISFDVSQGGGDECVGRSSQGGVCRRPIVFEMFVLCGLNHVLIRNFFLRDVCGDASSVAIDNRWEVLLTTLTG